jgi:hypothetical protein
MNVPQCTPREAFDQIFPTEEAFEECRNRVDRNLVRYVADPDQREDIVENAMLNALKHAPKFRRQSSPTTWITRIAIHEVFAASRKKKQPMLDMRDHEEEMLDPRKGPEKILERKEREGQDTGLIREIEALGPHLFRRYGLEVENAVLAKEEGFTPNGMKTKIRRELFKVRDVLGHRRN